MTEIPVTAFVIDDQDDIRFLISQQIKLSGDGVEVVAEAADGETALQMLRDMDEGVPTVVVLDWMMPGLNGVETAKAIRKARPGVRIILCSAFDGDAVQDQASDAGIDMFLPKEQISEIPALIKQLAALGPHGS
jgi:DNA-binding NarL/FixJ family response regulator